MVRAQSSRFPGQVIHKDLRPGSSELRNWHGKVTSKVRSIDEHDALKAAQELIRTGGLLNLKMKSVADRCGCAIGTIYRHFPSKGDLLAALLILEMQQRNDFYRKLANNRASSRKRMLGVLSAGFLFGPGNRQRSWSNCIPALEASLPPMSGQKREMLQRLREDLLATIRGIVHEALLQGELSVNARDPKDLCQVLLILMRGGQLLMETPAFIGCQPIESLQDVMILHFSHILNGLGWQPICAPPGCGCSKAEIEQLIRSAT